MTIQTRLRTAVSSARRRSRTALDRHTQRLDNQAGRLRRLEQQVQQQAARIAELEAEAQEARRLNKRIAELTDVVAEVVLPADQRDDARVQTLMTSFRDTFREV